MARSKPKHRVPVRASGLPTIAAAALILITGLAAYSNSFAGIFVFDDEPALMTATNWMPADTTLSGRPIAAVTFVMDRMLSGGSLAGYHTTNLLIHLAAALLVFGVTRRTLMTAPLRDRFGGSAATLALIVALLFVVHPIQTGAVTYIVQRVESLMGLLYLATLYCAIRVLDANERSRRVWAGASVTVCALGMATKEVMATAPLIVMLWDYEFAADLPRERRRLYAALASTWVILAVLVAGGHRSLSVGFGFAGWPWWRYLMTQAEVIAHYLRLALVPAPLVLDYDWRAAASLAQVALPGALLVALLAATAWGLWRRVPAAFAGAWFFLILAPSSSVIPVVTEVAAEHRMYLPVAAVIALAVLGLHQVFRRAPRLGVIAAAAVVLLFASMTYARNADYQDYDRIWSATIAARPHNARARNNYATSLVMKGRYAEAEPHLRVAVEENSFFAEAETNLGVALAAQGRLDEGIAHLRRAIEIKPDYVSAHRNLGESLAVQGRLRDAYAEYDKALALAKSKGGDPNLVRQLEERLALIAGDIKSGGR